ncbi:hypothetical protein LC082_11130 [Microbacterium esteraromaticum]|uniref:hypothetical protein n=1 Tax=Microbacterium esteraromaticum TaxID=57043 RepID=UPI001CD81655|nr:hypothetical protein [Microbacterium esteraromaticum]MCA1307453.1 hypothetical protein [Microbacterium esteraromaticum]
MMIARYRSLALGACVALAAALVVGVGPATADDSAGEDGVTVVTGGALEASASSLLPEDARALADDLSISEDEAQRRFAGQQEFLEALTKAIDGVPHRYSSS